MRPTTPGNPSEASPAASKSRPRASVPDRADQHFDPQTEVDTVRDTIDAWPDSGSWPQTPRPLPSFELDDLDDARMTEKDFGWDELADPDNDDRRWAPPRQSSTAPHAIPLDEVEDVVAVPARSRRRRVVAAIAAVCAVPFVVLGVYALASQGLGAWTGGKPSSLAAGVTNSPQPGQLARLSPEERAYRLAGDAVHQAAARASTACRGSGGTAASLWVTVSFGQNGRVSDVVIEGTPLDAPLVGACVERIVRESTVPPFRGDDVQVARAIVVEKPIPASP